MKHLKIFEKFENKDQFDIETIILYMVNIIDNYKVNFFDVDDSMINSEDKNIKKFQLSKDFHSIRRSRFTIEVMQNSSEQLTIHDIADISVEMSTVIKNIEREGWILSGYHVNQSKDDGKVVFYYIHYTFSKPDQEIEPNGRLEDIIPFVKLRRILDNEDIEIEKRNTHYLDNSIKIDEWYSETLSSIIQVEDALEKIINTLGGSEWEWYNGTNGIILYF